ncbi:YhdH/YhfP family quinone oxidoreductase [Pusillimonas sp. SM2304]|uniref:YhdH/YhfP family quinone oxidoreductase n=1 Tax=Pusillimonas sp. SM2304 TaxID=3073241 RepID=UPI00287652A3|nr:YhdH/YhfP family quinone oxidoreductase [Pusillimonas sp. SM2304]MDS1139441.1 YhdH/YhfP family quinone oxidoreductase [Pusillimonas sp. SM2304]
MALRSDYIDKRVTSTLTSLRLDDLSAGEVIIRTRYAGVNYKDCLSIKGKAKVITSYPRIAGIELVGDIVHASVDGFSAGQAVIVHGFQTGIAFDGGFAEYARVPAAHVMAIPAGLSPCQAAMIGVPGFTAAMALERFQQLGIGPEFGMIAVSGATGAVGILSILILSRAGYRVAALTRRIEEKSALMALGASEIIDARQIADETKLVETPRFAAAIDNVSGHTLSWLLRSLQDGGALAAVGNASGNGFETNILPFILRGIDMFGIVANAPWPVRERLWNRLATDWRPDFSLLKPHIHTIGIDGLLEYADDHLSGKASGRTLLRF